MKKIWITVILFLLISIKASAWTMYGGIKKGDSFIDVKHKMSKNGFVFTNKSVESQGLKGWIWQKDKQGIIVSFVDGMAEGMMMSESYSDITDAVDRENLIQNKLTDKYGNYQDSISKTNDYRWITSEGLIFLSLAVDNDMTFDLKLFYLSNKGIAVVLANKKEEIY